MGLVIDTSALVTIDRLAARGATPAEALAPLLASIGDEEVAVPVIVYAELLVGVELADSERRAAARRRRIEALMAHATLVEFDAAIAPVWARLFGRLSRSGRAVVPRISPLPPPPFTSITACSSAHPTNDTSARSKGSG